MTGQMVGPYEVVEKLGEGGMGVVYKARDTRLKRMVALKFLSAGNSDSSGRRRFLREAQAASSLNHPNIVSIFDLGEESDSVFLVMEYIEGKSLARLIPKTGLPLDTALAYARQIADALRVAHQAGIVHRDLKPGNVMQGADGRLKILDFGLAKVEIVHDDDDATATIGMTVKGGFLGTVAYTAPEQALGKTVDRRADIFSFGILLHEMLTGARPFQGISPFAVMHSITFGEPTLLRSVNPKLPASLESLILRALEKDPAKRFQSMDDVLAGLTAESAAAGHPPTAAPPPSSPSFAPLSAVSSLSRYPSGPPSSDSESVPLAVLPFLSLSADPEDSYLAIGIASEIIRALAGVPRVRVASQVASFRFQGGSPDLPAVAAALRVRYVVTGSLRRAANRIRVIAELADAVEGTMLWSYTYDRGIEDIFAVQEDIAHAVAGATGGQLIREHASRASFAAPENLDAWGLVHKAYHFINQSYNLQGINEAITLLRRAIEIAPNYSAAHAFLGLYLIQRIINSASENPIQDRADALAAAERAMQLTPAEPEVLENSGLVLLHCSRYDKSVQVLRRAVKIAPFNLVAWGYLGLALGWGGEDAEIEEGERILARVIDGTPDHPSMPYWLYFRSGALVRLGRLEDALEATHRSIELQPRFTLVLVAMANVLGHLGRNAEAMEVIGQVLALNPQTNQDAYLTELTHITRSRERAEPHFAGLIKAGIFHP
ncbi:MAG TPA: protein kinase [Paludibaculum sp.]